MRLRQLTYDPAKKSSRNISVTFVLDQMLTGLHDDAHCIPWVTAWRAVTYGRARLGALVTTARRLGLRKLEEQRSS
jgi:hypothetical protein